MTWRRNLFKRLVSNGTNGSNHDPFSRPICQRSNHRTCLSCGFICTAIESLLHVMALDSLSSLLCEANDILTDDIEGIIDGN